MSNLKNMHLRRFALFPATLACFAISLPFIYYTGGAGSPFLVETLGLLLIGGWVVQSRFKLKTVLVLTLITYFAWEAYGVSHDLSQYVPHPTLLVQTLNLAILLALLALVISFAVKLERNQETMERRERLLNVLFDTAHEMAQPIQVIMMSSSILKKMIEQNKLQPELVEQFAQRISEGAERASGLLQKFHNDDRESIQVADAPAKHL